MPSELHAIHPQRVFASAGPWPLHDATLTRAIEARALARTPPHALMARAGLAAARLSIAVAPHARNILVLAGPGNNGGDGLIAALHLQRLGRQVRVVHLADTQRLPADAADALRQARAAGLEFRAWPCDLSNGDLLVDALLGLGASRAPSEAIADAIRAQRNSGRPTLAIDLPSGLHPDTGAVLGELAVRADWTLSLLTLKPGLFTAQGRDHGGDMWIDPLGAAPPASASAWLGSACCPPPPGLPARLHAQHKGSFGDVGVVGGASGMQGAAWLASRAALAAGAGRVYASLLDPAPLDAASAEIMTRPLLWEAEPDRLRAMTVVCGCGGGAKVQATLARLLEHAGRLVLDADALNAIAADEALGNAVAARAERGAGTVLTPHPLEAARLLQIGASDVQSDRFTAAQRLARRFAAVVLLKGSGSIVATPGGVPWVNASGNASLAAAGTGDVLAGWIGGLWARLASHPDPRLAAADFAVRTACWLHGHAADGGGGQGLAPGHLPMRAGDLIDRMAAVLR